MKGCDADPNSALEIRYSPRPVSGSGLIRSQTKSRYFFRSSGFLYNLVANQGGQPTRGDSRAKSIAWHQRARISYEGKRLTDSITSARAKASRSVSPTNLDDEPIKMDINTADKYLRYVTIFLFIPMIFGAVPDFCVEKADLLTYFSFYLSVCSALYAGRGIFEIGKKKKSKEKAAHERNCYVISLLLLFGAALALMPILFKRAAGILPACGIVALIICLNALGYCFYLDRKKAGKERFSLYLPIGLSVVASLLIGSATINWWADISHLSPMENPANKSCEKAAG